MIIFYLYVMGCFIYIIFLLIGFYLNYCEMIKKKNEFVVVIIYVIK